jgi:HPt (histidine-containing phosphotransfer) domain-containing protein
MPAGSTPPPSIDHLDWGNALRGVNGDYGLLQELVQIFLDEIPGWLDQLSRSIEAGSVDLSRRTAHTVKGAVGQLSMTAAHTLAQQIEIACRNGQFDVAAVLLDELKLELATLKPHQLLLVESTRLH